MKSPPAIHHEPPRPQQYCQMIKDAARNVKLPKSPTNLLALYADCEEGFRPALHFVEGKTGIGHDHVSRTRDYLNDRGLIQYDNAAGKITIRWDRIKAFAMLTEPIVGAKKERFCPSTDSKTKEYSHPIWALEEYRQYWMMERPP